MTELQDRHIYCSFCKKHHSEVLWVVAGHGVFICDNCIDLCADILKEKREAATVSSK